MTTLKNEKEDDEDEDKEEAEEDKEEERRKDKKNTKKKKRRKKTRKDDIISCLTWGSFFSNISLSSSLLSPSYLSGSLRQVQILFLFQSFILIQLILINN